MRGTNSERSDASSRFHGVVTVSSTTSEIDTATRVTISAAESSPWRVSPAGWPNQVPSGTTIWPCVMKLSVAGATTIPVKIGMKSHTRLTKNRRVRPDVVAITSVARYMANEHRDVANERRGRRAARTA